MLLVYVKIVIIKMLYRLKDIQKNMNMISKEKTC